MPVVAYIANRFPSPVEPYVGDEIRELRHRGAHVIACTARAPESPGAFAVDISLQPVRLWPALCALIVLLRSIPKLADLWQRLLFEGRESLSRRCRCAIHTFLGAYFAVLLRPDDVDHIHAHHGYFSSWIALVAARLLDAGYSFTLHGSDLLMHPAFLDTKLEQCDFCLTISDFNRQHLFKTYPSVPAGKVIVQRLGVDSPLMENNRPTSLPSSCMVVLSVGRLHEVKNHAFLIDACSRLRERDVDVLCLIAGEGPLRPALEARISALALEQRVILLGHVPHHELDSIYDLADVVTLTSRSEGIPLALMEAMMRSKLVLAPDITGIPELVLDEQTGFLYPPGSLDDFVTALERLCNDLPYLDPVRRAAREHVREHFNRQTNLDQFADTFLRRVRDRQPTYAHPVLQQI